MFRRGRDNRSMETVSAVLLIGAVLTNDLHFPVFRPRIGPAEMTGSTGTYSYGALYWAACVRIALKTASGVCVLHRK